MIGAGASREISPSPRQHPGVAPWLLRKSLEVHAFKVCPKLAQRGGGICHGLFLLLLATQQGGDTWATWAEKLKEGHPLTPPARKKKKKIPFPAPAGR